MAELALKVNGKSYAGWESIRVTRSIESIAGAFELEVSDRWAGQAVPWPIVEEDECSITIGATSVLTGYVDRRSISYGAGEHKLKVSGRDRAAALVDCSAMLGVWEFQALSLHALAERLAKPFKIAVTMDAGLKGLPVPVPTGKFTIDPGETAFEVLERACRASGVVAVSDGVGGLHLTRAGSARTVTALVEGENILSAQAEYDAVGRFRKYTVTAQHPGTDDWNGEAAAGVMGQAFDLEVRRGERELMVRAEAALTPAQAKLRAAWEAKTRAARADAITITVQGWEQGDGSLWPVNARVPLVSPHLGMRTTMLISQVTFEQSQRGQRAQLSLRRPDAFIPDPTISKPSGLWKEIANGA